MLSLEVGIYHKFLLGFGPSIDLNSFLNALDVRPFEVKISLGPRILSCALHKQPYTLYWCSSSSIGGDGDDEFVLEALDGVGVGADPPADEFTLGVAVGEVVGVGVGEVGEASVVGAGEVGVGVGEVGVGVGVGVEELGVGVGEVELVSLVESGLREVPPLIPRSAAALVKNPR